jgi:hypothetical protein
MPLVGLRTGDEFPSAAVMEMVATEVVVMTVVETVGTEVFSE